MESFDPVTLQGLLKVYDPRAGRPVPMAKVYAANVRTRDQVAVEREMLERASRRAWAEYQQRQRTDQLAAQMDERWR